MEATLSRHLTTSGLGYRPRGERDAVYEAVIDLVEKLLSKAKSLVIG